jgi:hypothetical protein
MFANAYIQDRTRPHQTILPVERGMAWELVAKWNPDRDDSSEAASRYVRDKSLCFRQIPPAPSGLPATFSQTEGHAVEVFYD